MKKLIIKKHEYKGWFKWAVKEKVGSDISVVRQGYYNPELKKQVDTNKKEYTITALKKEVDRIVDKDDLLAGIKEPASEAEEWVHRVSPVVNFKELCRLVSISYDRFNNYKRGRGKVTLTEIQKLKDTLQEKLQ